ncbi:MAG: TetR/AcrR family transcriptional regulator [Alphaproteobacteria bacterium]|nr:TetR/AcrR family transcriptional regulator [Alphaproteobacteria bacterium]
MLEREFGDEKKDYAPREKGLKRRELFFEAATRAFVKHGFEKMSLKELVAETGGSMTTLYQNFGNKEKLFQEVIDSKYEAIYAKAYAFELQGLSIEEALQRVGQGVMTIVTSDEAMDLYRMIVVEAERLPQLRQRFIEEVLDRGKQALAGFLADEVEAGRIAMSDCQSAAAQYFGMVRRDFVVRRFLGDDLNLDKAAQEQIVKQAMDLFLRGILPR